MQCTRFITPLLAIGMLIGTQPLSGCAGLLVGAAAGVGTVAYVNGDLETIVEADLDDTWDATQQAIDDLQFNVTESGKDALTAHQVSRTAQDQKIQVKLKRETDNTTRITIRVDVFGDEDLSRLILDKIKSHLPKP